MKERYVMIAIGGIFLLLAVAALVFSRVKPKGSTEVTTNIIPTTSILPTRAPASETTGVSTGGMPLSISSPANNTIVTSSQILIRGKTAPGAEVFINEKEVVADNSGNFSTAYSLDEGENLIIVTANDSEGNMAEKELVVTYNVAE